MSSYAKAASKAGVGAEKPPQVDSVKQTSSPQGSVEVVPEDKLPEYEGKTPSGKAPVEDFSEEVKKAKETSEKKSNECFNKLYEKLSQGYKDSSDFIGKVGIKSKKQGKLAIEKTSKELQNPVVLIQLLVGATAGVCGYFGYLERNRIDYSNKVTLGLHSAILTGLVLIDGALFTNYYPKYKKD